MNKHDKEERERELKIRQTVQQDSSQRFENAEVQGRREDKQTGQVNSRKFRSKGEKETDM